MSEFEVSVSNVPLSYTRDDICRLVELVSRPVSCRLIKSDDESFNKALVKFKSLEDAKNVVEILDKTVGPRADASSIRFCVQGPDSGLKTKFRVYVVGLPWGVPEPAVRELLGKCTTPEKIEIRHIAGKSGGYSVATALAHILCDEKEKMGVMELDGREYFGHTLKVRCVPVKNETEKEVAIDDVTNMLDVSRWKNIREDLNSSFGDKYSPCPIRTEYPPLGKSIDPTECQGDYVSSLVNVGLIDKLQDLLSNMNCVWFHTYYLFKQITSTTEGAKAWSHVIQSNPVQETCNYKMISGESAWAGSKQPYQLSQPQVVEYPPDEVKSTDSGSGSPSPKTSTPERSDSPTQQSGNTTQQESAEVVVPNQSPVPIATVAPTTQITQTTPTPPANPTGPTEDSESPGPKKTRNQNHKQSTSPTSGQGTHQASSTVSNNAATSVAGEKINVSPVKERRSPPGPGGTPRFSVGGSSPKRDDSSSPKEPLASRIRFNKAGMPSYITGPIGANLFVYNLAIEINDDVLKVYFGKIEGLLSCCVYIDPELQSPKGFGFVSYSTVEQAKKAIDLLDGIFICGRRIAVDVKRDEKEALGLS